MIRHWSANALKINLPKMLKVIAPLVLTIRHGMKLRKNALVKESIKLTQQANAKNVRNPTLGILKTTSALLALKDLPLIKTLLNAFALMISLISRLKLAKIPALLAKLNGLQKIAHASSVKTIKPGTPRPAHASVKEISRPELTESVLNALHLTLGTKRTRSVFDALTDLLSIRMLPNVFAPRINPTSIMIRLVLLAIQNGMRLQIPALCASWELSGKHQTRHALKDALIPWSTMNASAPLPLQFSMKLHSNANPAIRKSQSGTAKSANPALQVRTMLLLLVTVSPALRELNSTKKSKSVSMLD
jgi:hypothetical protein